jgi:hypothetical protein
MLAVATALTTAAQRKKKWQYMMGRFHMMGRFRPCWNFCPIFGDDVGISDVKNNGGSQKLPARIR